MLQPIAGQTNYLMESPSSTSQVCKTRTDLLDRLADVIASLGHSKLELTGAAEEGDMLLYESAKYKVVKLRGESTSIRSQLEQHRSQHCC